MSIFAIVGAVEAVKVVDEAKRRIPGELGGLTFYGEYDEWMFLSSGHPHMCADCASYEGDIYWGTELRTTFPYHTILDANTIAASVHPNCSCLLLRAIPMGDYI